MRKVDPISRFVINAATDNGPRAQDDDILRQDGKDGGRDDATARKIPQIPPSTFVIQGEKKGLQILLSYSQAGPGRKAKLGQEKISRNRVLFPRLCTFCKQSSPSASVSSKTTAKCLTGKSMSNISDQGVSDEGAENVPCLSYYSRYRIYGQWRDQQKFTI